MACALETEQGMLMNIINVIFPGAVAIYLRLTSVQPCHF